MGMAKVQIQSCGKGSLEGSRYPKNQGGLEGDIEGLREKTAGNRRRSRFCAKRKTVTLQHPPTKKGTARGIPNMGVLYGRGSLTADLSARDLRRREGEVMGLDLQKMMDRCKGYYLKEKLGD